MAVSDFGNYTKDNESAKYDEVTSICDDLIDEGYGSYINDLRQATQGDIKTIAAEVAEERGIVLNEGE